MTFRVTATSQTSRVSRLQLTITHACVRTADRRESKSPEGSSRPSRWALLWIFRHFSSSVPQDSSPRCLCHFLLSLTSLRVFAVVPRHLPAPSPSPSPSQAVNSVGAENLFHPVFLHCQSLVPGPVHIGP